MGVLKTALHIFSLLRHWGQEKPSPHQLRKDSTFPVCRASCDWSGSSVDSISPVIVDASSVTLKQ